MDLEGFNTVKLENIDTKKMAFSCNLLKVYECSNIEFSDIKYNTIKEFTNETE